MKWKGYKKLLTVNFINFLKKKFLELNLKFERLRRVSTYEYIVTETNHIRSSLIKESELLLSYCKKVYTEHHHLNNVILFDSFIVEASFIFRKNQRKC